MDSVDQLSLQKLFLEHSDAIKGFILGLNPDFHAANDIFQDVFVTVTESAASFRSDAPFLPWVYGIARNKVLQHYRVSKNHVRPLAPQVTDLLMLARENSAAEPDRRTQYLLDCMKKLGPRALEMIRLRYEKNRKPNEIALSMKCKPESVYVALNRIRTQLRECAERAILAHDRVSGKGLQ